VHPALKSFRIAQRPKILVSAQECLLRHVFSVSAISQNAVCDLKNASLALLNPRSKTLLGLRHRLCLYCDVRTGHASPAPIYPDTAVGLTVYLFFVESDEFIPSAERDPYSCVAVSGRMPTRKTEKGFGLSRVSVRQLCDS